MKSRESMDDMNARLRRTFGIYLHENLSRWAIFPWWATMTHGIGCLGDMGGGVWHARTRERLIAKCERFARREALRSGVRGELIIEIREPLG